MWITHLIVYEVSTSLGAKTPEQALLNLLQCQEAKPVDAFEATFADGHTSIDLVK